MSDADYELWAAMMADDEDVAAPVVTPVVEVAPVFQPVVEAPKFFPLTPITPVQPVAETPAHAVEDVPVPAIVSADERNDDVGDFEVEEELEFPSNFFKEPQTNSITVAEVPDALTADIITESGEILKTGAIDMPILNNTGSIPIITITPDSVDEDAIIADMGDETTAGIPPIRSGSVMNSSARVGVLPIKNRRSEGQIIVLVTTSILLVALGAGLIAAYMFKLI